MSAAVVIERLAEATPRLKARAAGLLYFAACHTQPYLTGEN